MIFFVDRNNPNYLGFRKFKETSAALIEASDQDRVAYVESFLDWYYTEFENVPASPLLERLANFTIRPYIGNKEVEHKILSIYSLERREQKQTNYNDGVGY